MKRTRVGVVGAGTIANQVHLPVLAAMDDVQVEWILDTNTRLARSVARAHRAPIAAEDAGLELQAPVDIVLLAIPLPPRRRYLDHCRGTTTAVFVEKPPANDADEHRRLVADFPAWQLGVGYQRRYWASMLLVRRMIETGTLGELVGIRVSEGGRTTSTGGAGQFQSLSIREGGGLVKNLGCHDLDLVLWLTRATRFDVQRREIAWDGDSDQRCIASIELEDADGRRIALDYAMSWIDRMENVIEFRFAGGILSCPTAPATSVALKSPGGTPIARLPVDHLGGATTVNQAFFLEWRGVVDAVSTRTPQPISGTGTLLCSELIDALLEREGVGR